MTSGDPVPAPRPTPPTSRLDLARRIVGRACAAAFGVGLVVSSLAWLLPLRALRDPGVYDLFFAVAFFTRVFLLPVALAWLALGVVAIACRRRRIGIACAAIAIAWAAPEAWLARKPFAGPTGPTFSVASFNLNKDLRDATALVAEVRRMDADFVAFQEVTPPIAAALTAALADRYPHALVFPDASYDGAAIFARTPIDLIRAPAGRTDRSLSATATAAGRAFRLVDVHLASPGNLAKMRTSREQIERLIADAGGEPLPTLAVGDFNSTTFSPQGSALAAAGFVDAYRVAGRGRQVTWPASGFGRAPRVRIDTAYTTRDAFRAVETETGHAFGSDHLPIKVTYQASP